MTQTQTTPAQIAEAAHRATAIAHAEAYFAAQRQIDAFKKSAAGKKLAALEADKKNAIDTLAAMYPAERNHDAAIHPITVDGNSTATFLHRTDNSIKWQKVAEGVLPHLDRTQQGLWQNLRDANTSPRTTKTLKK